MSHFPLVILDPHSRLSSPVHRLPAWLKLAASLLILAVILTAPPAAPLFLLVPAAVLLLVAAVSRIPFVFLLRRLVLLEPLVLGMAILTLFQPHGLRLFVLLAVRSSLCLLTMILLSNSTPFSAMLSILRRCRIPGLLITTLALLYRYLFVLAEEGQRMSRARASRTFAGPSTLTGRWQLTATIASQLFIRATERAQRVYSAMCARGWQ